MEKKQVITKVKKCSTFPQQIKKVKKKKCAPTSILGVHFGKRKMQSLKNP
jgi:hypothetical protein